MLTCIEIPQIVLSDLFHYGNAKSGEQTHTSAGSGGIHTGRSSGLS